MQTLSAKKSKKSKEVQSESEFMPACASPSGFAVPLTFQFHPIVVSLSDERQECAFMS